MLFIESEKQVISRKLHPLNQILQAYKSKVKKKLMVSVSNPSKTLPKFFS